MDAHVSSPHGRVAAMGALLLAAAALTEAQNTAGAFEKPGYVDGSLQYVVRTRAIALEKLGASGCRELFTEFEDLTGRRLVEVLVVQNETAEQHLLRMSFRDGSFRTPCRQQIYAFTVPGSLDIFLCSAFRGAAKRDVSMAANTLIHEELHSLGAGEAPAPELPTSQEISDRVMRRCGR